MSKTPVTLEPPAPAVPSMGLPGGSGFGEGDVHLLDRVSVLYRYRRIVVSVVTLVLIAAAVQTYTTTPEYHTTAKVEVRPEHNNANLVQTAFGDSDDLQTQTELQNMQTRSMIKRVLKNHQDISNSPELNGKNAESSGLLSSLDAVRVRIMTPIKALIGGAPSTQQQIEKALAGSQQHPPTVAVSPAADASEETPEEARRVNAFIQRLDVKPEVGSRLFDITLTASDPAFASDAANKLAEEYVARNLEIKQGSLKLAVDKGEQELQTAINDRDAKQKDIRDIEASKEGRDFLNPTTVNQRLEGFRSALDDANSLANDAQEVFNRLNAYHVNDPKTNVESCGVLNEPEVRSDGGVTGFLAALRQDRQSRTNLINVLLRGPNHPDVIAADAKIVDDLANLKVQVVAIIDAAQKKLTVARGVVGAKEERYRTYNDLANGNAQKGSQFSELQQFAASAEAAVLAKTTALDATRRALISVENNTRVADFAQTPTSPFKPKASVNMMIGLALGVGLAALLAFVLDYLDDTVKTPEDITRKLHLPFLGLVPSVHGDRQPVLSGPVPHDFGEAYRALRTSLVFTSGGETTRVIAITSAQPLEGKTTTACNLAMVLAFGGSRVLLIDADMRRPGVHKALKINNTVGLSHLLVGQARVREAIQRTSDPNFCVMTAGRTPPNPSELLASERMKQLVSNLKQGPFDWVVIDTPPVLAVTDAIIVTPMADCALFVLGAEMTRRRLAERAVNMLLSCRPKVVGAVLNRVNFDRNKYYYSRYYGYQYKSYYGTNAGVSTPPPEK